MKHSVSATFSGTLKNVGTTAVVFTGRNMAPPLPELRGFHISPTKKRESSCPYQCSLSLSSFISASAIHNWPSPRVRSMAPHSWQQQAPAPTLSLWNRLTGRLAWKPIIHPEDGHHIVSLRFSVHTPQGSYLPSPLSISLISYTKKPAKPALCVCPPNQMFNKQPCYKKDE